MEQETESSIPPIGISVGEVLRSQREAAGLSLNEVAERLKLSLRQLEAIERNDFDALPGAVFIRGFVRNYARFLELDPTPLMDALDAHFPSAVHEVANLAHSDNHQQTQQNSHTNNIWLILTLLGVVLCAATLWFFGLNSGRRAEYTVPPPYSEASEKAAQTAASAALLTGAPPPQALRQPVSAASVAVSSVVNHQAARTMTKVASAPVKQAVKKPASPATIVVNTEESAWVSIVDMQGKKLVFTTLEPGESREASGVPPFRVRIGNAAKVSLHYNGQAVNISSYTHGAVADFQLP